MFDHMFEYQLISLYPSGRDDDISVTIEESDTQVDPTNTNSASFIVNFDTQIDPTSFSASDIILTGTTTGSINLGPTDLGEYTSGINYGFTVSNLTHNDTVSATMSANSVASYISSTFMNKMSTSSDNEVTYLDNIPPTAPVVNSVEGDVTDPYLTNDTAPDIVIAAENASAVTIPGWTCTPTPVSAGTVSCTPDSALSEGLNTITPRATDSVGNITDGAITSFTIDSSISIAIAPDLQTASDSGNNNTDNITNNTKPIFDVKCTEPGTITLLIDGIK